MNLTEIQNWAKKIDLLQVNESRREHARCYRDMIINNVDEINRMTNRIDKFMIDIHEHLGQLEKIDIKLPEEKEAPEGGKHNNESKRISPILP